MNEESRALEDQRVGFRLVVIPGILHIGVVWLELIIHLQRHHLQGASRCREAKARWPCLHSLCCRVTYHHDPASVALCEHAMNGSVRI